jgi:hypothetical protein
MNSNNSRSSKSLNSLNLAFTKKKRPNKQINTLKADKRYAFVDKMIKNREIKTVEPGVLTVSAYAGFYPLAYKEADTRGNLIWKGFDVDFIRKFGELIGYKVKFVEVATFKNIWDLPRQGISDLAIGGIANSIGPQGPRGGEETEWTLPYFYVNRSVIIKKGTKFPSPSAKIAAVDGSTGWNDGTLRGAAGMGELVKATTDDEDLPKLREIGANGIPKLTAVMHGNNVSRALIRKNGKNNLRMISWEMAPTLLQKDGEIFAYPTKLGSGLGSVLSAFITKSVLNGYLEFLVNKYHLDLDHFIQEGVIPTGEFTAPPGLKPAADLSKRIKGFLEDANKDSTRKSFKAGIESDLDMKLIATPVKGRLAAQLKNPYACDNQLITLYLYGLGKNGLIFSRHMNPKVPIAATATAPDVLFTPDEFKFISVKFAKLISPSGIFYDNKSQTLKIDCRGLMNEIRDIILAFNSKEEKEAIYHKAVKAFIKRCISEILYKSMDNSFMAPDDIFKKLFIN